MKRQRAIFFLAILSLPAVYKVGLFTFYQLNKDYIAENYCVNKDRPITMCYGSCFLDKGLALADQTPSPQSLTPTVKFELPEFVIDEYPAPVIFSERILTFSISSTPSIAEGISPSIFHPPLI